MLRPYMRKLDVTPMRLHLGERADSYFFEEDNVVVAVILQADVAFVGAAAVLRFEIEFALGYGAAFGVVGDADAVDLDDRARAIERDHHRVPLGAGLAGA